jgi:hypothetical protein
MNSTQRTINVQLRKVAATQGPIACSYAMKLGYAAIHRNIVRISTLGETYSKSLYNESPLPLLTHQALSNSIYQYFPCPEVALSIRLPTSQPSLHRGYPLPLVLPPSWLLLANRIGRNIIGHPDNDVPTISSGTYLKNIVKDPSHAVSVHTPVYSYYLPIAPPVQVVNYVTSLFPIFGWITRYSKLTLTLLHTISLLTLICRPGLANWGSHRRSHCWYSTCPSKHVLCTGEHIPATTVQF